MASFYVIICGKSSEIHAKHSQFLCSIVSHKKHHALHANIGFPRATVLFAQTVQEAFLLVRTCTRIHKSLSRNWRGSIGLFRT